MHPKFEHHTHARTNCDCVVHRRDFLRVAAATGAAAGMMSWTDAICLSAEDMRKRGMACILLWMGGGPSQFETFSPKPGHANGGETKAIATSVPGIQIAETLPNMARVMNDLAIIRSMTSKEGSHPRASFLLHHGYLPMGGVKFPTLGSHVAHQIGDPKFDLPSFVRIGGRRADLGGAGFLGVDYDPFVLRNPEAKPENTQPVTSLMTKQRFGRGKQNLQDIEPAADARYARRLEMLDRLQSDFGKIEGADIVADHRKLIRKSSDMILSPKMEAFDLANESDGMRDAYGRNPFGAGCLLARRLVEAGVTFVEVNLEGWDTHEDNFTRTAQRNEIFDKPMAQLITDLKQRGMLDRTLVLWMGEFGRTPRINARAGRDHYPRAFNIALAGSGIRGGQVIGETDAGGIEVSERPVAVSDLFRTVYTTLGINADHENMSRIGRPIKLVDGGEVIRELLG
ncbi:MAG: DUF1501 domain-containing protein [Planctomycetes bacterium]|nr:DUF1501 domain-containing protein [Planctomycetota bacterium]